MPTWLWVGVCVLVLALIADRIAAVVAQRAVQNVLASYLPNGQQAKVRVRGALFVPQASRGRYGAARVRGRIALGPIDDARIEAHLYGVCLPARDVFGGGGVREVPVERVDADVLLPYAQLPSLTPVAGLTISPNGDALAVSAPLRVPGVGGVVRVNGHGSVHLVDGKVQLRVSGLRVAGVRVPRLVVAQMSRALATMIAVPPLPYGLEIVSLATRSGGITIHCVATDVVLGPPESRS